MNINVICIGNLKEKYWVDACAEYQKRLKRFCNFNVIELKESKLPKNASLADEQGVIEKEGETILAKIGKDDYVIAMEIEGKMLDSVELSRKIQSVTLQGKSTIDFVIGGSLGLSDAVKRRADYGLSFSKMTFPHQLARVMILEQVYRAFMISSNATYHK